MSDFSHSVEWIQNWLRCLTIIIKLTLNLLKNYLNMNIIWTFISLKSIAGILIIWWNYWYKQNFEITFDCYRIIWTNASTWTVNCLIKFFHKYNRILFLLNFFVNHIHTYKLQFTNYIRLIQNKKVLYHRGTKICQTLMSESKPPL